MKRYFLVLLGMVLLTKGFSEEMHLDVTNPCGFQRHEVIELNAREVLQTLQGNNPGYLTVKNAIGQQVPSQLTYNGMLLIDVNVRPYSTTRYWLSTGKPDSVKVWVWGRWYPERKDDIAWENDRCAYRVYGPALEKTGEKAYGIDVWVKNTPDLVVEKRYAMDIPGAKETEQLKREGKNKEAFDSYLKTSFHLDHGYGYDPYKVGPSLGCGTPALMNKGKLVFPYCYQHYRILDNGPLRFTVELTYAPSAVGDSPSVIEHRIISLDKGSNFNKMTVWYSGLKHPSDFAAGVVVHEEDTTAFTCERDYVEYADPTDNVTGNSSQVYVAALFPEGIDTTTLLKYEKPEDGNFGHLIGIRHHMKDNEKYTYYFGAAWSKYDIRTQAEWQLRIREFLQEKREPLILQYK